jgi:hypothetical protein
VVSVPLGVILNTVPPPLAPLLLVVEYKFPSVAWISPAKGGAPLAASKLNSVVKVCADTESSKDKNPPNTQPMGRIFIEIFSVPRLNRASDLKNEMPITKTSRQMGPRALSRKLGQTLPFRT